MIPYEFVFVCNGIMLPRCDASATVCLLSCSSNFDTCLRSENSEVANLCHELEWRWPWRYLMVSDLFPTYTPKRSLLQLVHFDFDCSIYHRIEDVCESVTWLLEAQAGDMQAASRIGLPVCRISMAYI